MTSETAERPRSNTLFIGTSIVLVALGMYAAAQLEDLVSLSDADPSGVDTAAAERLLTQMDNGDWDPEDPNDFRKIIALVIAIGVTAAAIAALVGMNARTAERWASGQSTPARVARRPVFEAIKDLLRSRK